MLRLLHSLALLAVAAAYGDDPRISHIRGSGGPMPGTLSSVGDAEHAPPLYRPGSQAYVVSQFVKPKPPHQYWEEETSLTLVPENKNCLLCETMDTGACRAMPSCVYCELTVTALCERSTPCLRCAGQYPTTRTVCCETVDTGACRAMPSCVYCELTVTALCERSTPCLRCAVIKNPFFKCIPGEKYMDECDSCRCADGRSGWCTDQYCEFRALHLYAAKLSDGEFY